MVSVRVLLMVVNNEVSVPAVRYSCVPEFNVGATPDRPKLTH